MYFVYILASQRNGTLYIGVTNAVINRQADVRLSTLSSLLAALGYGLNVHRTTREVA